MAVTIGVPAETFPGERRVAMTPRAMDVLAKSGVELVIESGAGLAAGFPDEEYREKGAGVVPDRAEVFASSEVILQVRTPGANPQAGMADLKMLRSGQVLIGFGEPLNATTEYAELAEHGVSTRTITRQSGTAEILIDAPDGIEIQLQDVSYCGGRGRLGNMCA